MIRISAPAPIRGDIVLLGSGYGLLNPGGAFQSVGSFLCPGLNYSDKVLIYTENYKDGLTGDFINIATSNTDGGGTPTSPGGIRTALQQAWVTSEVTRTINGTERINYLNFKSTASTDFVTSSNAWGGSASADTTIYVNMLPAAAIDIYYKWSAYLIGDGVK